THRRLPARRDRADGLLLHRPLVGQQRLGVAVHGDRCRLRLHLGGAALLSAQPGRPTSNGCVERVQLTILEECWRPSFARSLVPRSTALKQDLDEYLLEYNYDRAHTGRLTQGRVPADIVHGARKTTPGR